jgi:anaerobic ribonucleoside-triphosphate reductase activating protein
MNIARILYPVKVLGPGDRIGIWVAGCPRRCRGCINPELWEQRPECEIPLAGLLAAINEIASTNPVDGFTITGGEPMSQAEDLAQLARSLSPISPDILVYTGHTYGEVRQLAAGKNDVLKDVAVLIDGPYIDELNAGTPLRGSANQNIMVLDSHFRELYQNYLSSANRQIQNFTTTDGVVSVGIHPRGFWQPLSAKNFCRPGTRDCRQSRGTRYLGA